MSQGATKLNIYSGTINSDTITAGTINIGTVVGKDAPGAAPTGFPVLLAGFDGVNVQRVSTNTSGQLQVNNVDLAQGISGSDARSNGLSSDMIYNSPSIYNGATWDRVRSGTAAVGIPGTGVLGALILGTDSGGTVRAGIVDASGNQKVAVTAGTVVGTFLELTGSATAGTTDIIAATDVSNYRSASLQLLNTWTGTVNVQASNDNSNFTTQFPLPINSPNGPVSNVISNNTYYFPIMGRYLRVRMQAFTSGTAQGILELNTLPATQYHNTSASQSGAWNVTGTIATGTVQNVSTGTINALASGTITAGTVALTYPSFSYISAAGTTTIKSGTGILGNIILGSLIGAGTLYNSAGTSSAIIWSADTATTSPQTLNFNLSFGSLTWAGTGAQNLTIVYA